MLTGTFYMSKIMQDFLYSRGIKKRQVRYVVVQSSEQSFHR